MGELKRYIGLLQATALVVGTIIGASIFVQPSVITGEVPSVAGVFAVWAVAGLLTLFGALVAAELASAFPETGGVYVFLREAWGPATGFLWGWAMFWVMHSGIVAAIAVVFARYAAFFFPFGAVGIDLVAIGCVLLLSVVNYVGVKPGSALQTAFTIGKVAAVLLIIAAGFWLGRDLPEHFAAASEMAAPDTAAGGTAGGASGGASPARGAGGGFGLLDFGQALVAGLFAFGGWHMVTYAAEETRRPEWTIPRALLVGMAIVTLSYLALNAVYLYVLPLDVVVGSDRVAADAADALLGSGGGAFMSALVMFSTFGALAGIVLVGPRVYWAMARDGLLFRWVGAVHPRFRTPHRAIVLQAIWSSVLVATGTYRTLFTRVIYTEWIFFALMALGLVLLRRRSGYEPRYRVWGYPGVPVVFAAAALAIVGAQIAAEPAESAFGLAVVAAGLPVYFWWTRRRGPATVGAETETDGNGESRRGER